MIFLFYIIKNLTNPLCVYWNFTAAGTSYTMQHIYSSHCTNAVPLYLGGRGNWSTDGCNTTVNATSDLTFIICHCNHLTNFACLVVSNI